MVSLALVLAKQLLVEVFEGLESKSEWPVNLGESDACFILPSFALFALPQKYGPLGERLRYQAPILIRMTGRVNLGDHTYTFLDRTNRVAFILIQTEGNPKWIMKIDLLRN